jgi:hypothetical protein
MVQGVSSWHSFGGRIFNGCQFEVVRGGSVNIDRASPGDLPPERSRDATTNLARRHWLSDIGESPYIWTPTPGSAGGVKRHIWWLKVIVVGR